jgi:L-aminopeptidase/D-esterase-like protein
MASDARQRNERESLQPRADCQVNQPLKAGLFRVSFGGGFSVGRGGGISAAAVVGGCGTLRWPLRQPSLTAAAFLAAAVVGNIVEACGKRRW